ncbi:MAG: DUF2809 domain-containing protein [Akkermansiaceae bacterium]
MTRSRSCYLILIAVVILLGLASRSPWAAEAPHFVTAYAGDTLWALMVFFILGFLFPRSQILPLGLAALGIAFSVELSQLYQANWIIQLRATWLGALALGSGFLWSDLLCYLVGVSLGIAFEHILKKRRPEQPEKFAHRKFE